jgi:hypothetical protein
VQAYYVRSAEVMYLGAFAMLVVAAFSLLVALVGISQGDDRSWVKFAFFVVFGLAWLGGALGGMRDIHQIRLDRSGTVEFSRGLGAVRVESSAIHALEGKFEREYDGSESWHLIVHLAGGHLTVDQFRDVLAFVDRVRMHNPQAAVIGLWPLGLLPPLGR